MLEALRLFAKLTDHLEDNGVDAEAKVIATKLIDFFSSTARDHHAEEERVVFPPLLVSEDKELVQHVLRLQQDHGWLEEDWIELSPQLKAVSEGYSWYDVDALRAGITVFTELYLDHIDLEESLIYPAAKRVLSGRTDAGQGRALSQERRSAAAA